MSDVPKDEMSRYVCPRVQRFAGSLVLGTGGSIASQSGLALSGVVFTKNAASGRFDGVLFRGFKRAIAGGAQVGNPTPGAFNQVRCHLQGIAAGSWLGDGITPVAAFSIQSIFNAPSGIAINPGQGSSVNWWLEVSDL